MTKQIGPTFRQIACVGFGALAVAGALVAVAQSQEAGKAFKPVTDKMLQNPPAADWLTFRGTLSAWGYSPLEQIDAGNVKGLKEVWSAKNTNTNVAPLVHD